MIIGVAKEIKSQENRVALTPAGADALIRQGHQILVERNAGIGSGFKNEAYEEVGAVMVDDVAKLWEESQMIVKVKELQASEFKYLREGLIVFTYLHLANEAELTKALIESKSVAIAYETVQLENRSLPLLTPMSEVGGRLAVQIGSRLLENINGGKGKLIDGLPGVAPAHIVIVGAGIVGTAALRRAIGLGARVTVLDIDVDRLRYLGEVFMGKVETLYSNSYNLEEALKTADLVIGAVLIPGSKAPKLISEEMVKLMSPGSVIVDVAIDQGGCVETIDKPTSYQEPSFIKHGVVHCAIPNLPGAVAQSSTLVLTNATLPYIMRIANQGWKKAMVMDPALAKGANIVEGKVSYQALADVFDLEFTPIEDIING